MQATLYTDRVVFICAKEEAWIIIISEVPIRTRPLPS